MVDLSKVSDPVFAIGIAALVAVLLWAFVDLMRHWPKE